jgi:hypothetical protein
LKLSEKLAGAEPSLFRFGKDIDRVRISPKSPSASRIGIIDGALMLF